MPHDKEYSEPSHRKLTTILAADVVGYSRMMNVDEDGTHELLRKCRRIIDRNIEHHGGRIFNTAGDSVMAEFGSTVEAVRSAIEIQDEIVAHNTDKPESEQMWFRIGLNVGDVIIEGDDLIGDGVNIASRMESIAKPGGISISGSVYELVHNKLSFAFEDMGAQSVKNIIDPIPTYSLLPAATPTIIPGMAEKLSPGKVKRSQLKLQFILATLILVTTAIIVMYLFATDIGNLQTVTKPPSAKSIPEAVPEPKPVLKPSPEPSTKQAVVLQPTIISEPMMVQDNTPAERPKITPSYFVGRSIEGVTSTSDKRFIIEMTARGSAIVTIYKRDDPGVRSGTDSGRWWIDKHDRACFEFKKFSKGRKFCRIHSIEDDREFLVSGNPGKPIWTLHPK